jgi:hypothetical protein
MSWQVVVLFLGFSWAVVAVIGLAVFAGRRDAHGPRS